MLYAIRPITQPAQEAAANVGYLVALTKVLIWTLELGTQADPRCVRDEKYGQGLKSILVST